VQLAKSSSSCDRTVNANDPEFTLPEEEEDYDWHTAGYYHEDEDAA